VPTMKPSETEPTRNTGLRLGPAFGIGFEGPSTSRGALPLLLTTSAKDVTGEAPEKRPTVGNLPSEDEGLSRSQLGRSSPDATEAREKRTASGFSGGLRAWGWKKRWAWLVMSWQVAQHEGADGREGEPSLLLNSIFQLMQIMFLYACLIWVP
jgi:hypothetical protein